MTKRKLPLALLLAASLSCGAAVQAQQLDYVDRQGLQSVDAADLDEAWVRPGADLSVFHKVRLEPATLAFKSDWRRKINLSNQSLSRKLTDAQVEQIKSRTLEDFDAVFAEQLRAAGYQLVANDGPDVLVLQPAISELYLNDPGIESNARSDVFVKRAGQGTLTVLARDANGQLLGAAIDHRQTRDHNVIHRSSTVFTQSDLRELFADWGQTSGSDLRQLHQRPALSQAD